MANYELADLMDKLRRSTNLKLECTTDGRQWTLMKREDAMDAGSTHCIFSSGSNTVDRSYFWKLHEAVKMELNIDFVEEVSLDDWMELPTIAALYNLLIASHQWMLKCTTNGKNWSLALVGNGFDASYQAFEFDDGIHTERCVKIGGLHKRVKQLFQIDLLEVPLKEWKEVR